MTEDERAVLRLLEDTERVVSLMNRRRRAERDEWRATWSPITMRLCHLDDVRSRRKRLPRAA